MQVLRCVLALAAQDACALQQGHRAAFIRRVRVCVLMAHRAANEHRPGEAAAVTRSKGLSEIFHRLATVVTVLILCCVLRRCVFACLRVGVLVLLCWCVVCWDVVCWHVGWR